MIKKHTPQYEGDTAAKHYVFLALYGFFAALRIFPMTLYGIAFVLYQASRLVATTTASLADWYWAWSVGLPNRFVYGRDIDRMNKRAREEAGIYDD